MFNRIKVVKMLIPFMLNMLINLIYAWYDRFYKEQVIKYLKKIYNIK